MEKHHHNYFVFAIALFFLTLSIPVLSYTVDDAYISFRYSYNFAHGNGLVYNIGEYVEGYTNFLWVVLVAPFTYLPLPIEIPAKIISLLSSIGTIFLLFKLTKMTEESELKLLNYLAPILTAFSFPFILYSTAGLETALFTLLLLYALTSLYEEIENDIYGPSNFIFLALSLTRPEGCFFFGMAFIYRFFLSLQKSGISGIYNKKLLLWLISFITPATIYFLLRYSYFGELLPNTFYAKTGDLTAQWNGGVYYFNNFWKSLYPLGYLFVPLYFFLLITKSKAQSFYIYVTVNVVLFFCYVSFVGGDWMKLFRFYHPAIPLLFFLFQQGIIVSHKKYISGIKSVALRSFLQDTLYFLLSVPLIALLANNYIRDLREIKSEQIFWERSARRIATWLEENGKPLSSISMGDIGEIGYRTNYHVIDNLGLVTPYVSSLKGGYTTKQPKKIAQYILNQKPEYILFITVHRTMGNEVRPHLDVNLETVRIPYFKENYVTFLELQVTDHPHYWVIMRHKKKADQSEMALFPGISKTRNSDLYDRYQIEGMEGENSVFSSSQNEREILSDPFTIEGNKLTFLHASGKKSKKMTINLIVNGEIVKTIYSEGNKFAKKQIIDTSQWRGSSSQIKIVNHESATNGFLVVDFFRHENV